MNPQTRINTADMTMESKVYISQNILKLCLTAHNANSSLFCQIVLKFGTMADYNKVFRSLL